MAITLDDVVLEQMNTNETLGQLVDRTNILIEMEGDSFAGLELLNEQFEDFLGLVRRQYSLEDEARREERAKIVPKADGDDSDPLKPEEAYKGIEMPIVTFGAGLVMFMSDFVKGFVDQTKKMFRVNVFKPIETVFGFIGDKLKSVTDFFKNIGSKISGLFGGIDTKGGSQFLENIKKMVAPISEFGAKLMNSPFVKALAGLGKLLGRLAVPLVALYETFTNVSEELGKSGDSIFGTGGKIQAVMKGVLKAVVDFFAIFLDIPKSIISWFAGLVGFDGIEKALDSFTFAGLGDAIIDGMFDILNGLSDFFGTIFTNAKDLFTGEISFEDFGKNIVRAVLPAPDFLAFEVPSIEVLGKTIGGGSIDLNPIPASVYEYAGLNAPEGSSSETPSGGDTTTNNVSTVGGTEVTGGDKLSSENIEVLRQQFNAEALQAINEENAITNAINTESVTNVGSSQSAPIVIQDNSVNSSNQSNVNQSVQSRRSMRSPTRNNGTRASAYEA